MSDPLISWEDLAVYLSDDRIDQDRAADMISDAQTLCEGVVSPLPASASVVVKRVAGRAYVTTLSSKQAQAQAAGGMFSGSASGGVWLTKADKADLRRLNGGGGGAFSVDLLPADYAAPSTVVYAGSDEGLYLTDWDVIP
jgi:hypothetical protein